jgi:multiple sugar transport system permease protein
MDPAPGPSKERHVATSATTTTDTSAIQMEHPRGGSWATRRRLNGWLMVAPTVVTILVVGIFPLFYSLCFSFRRWDLKLPGRPWVGLDNYSRALSDDRVWSALGNTLVITVLAVGVEFVLGLGLALILIDELRGKRFIIPLLMLPVMMVPVVVALTWRLLWDPTSGPINWVIGTVLRRDFTLNWFAEKNTALTAVIVTEIWQWTPFMFLVLLAGLAGVNAELYDAAALDGGSWWSTFKDITLPALAPVITVALVFRALEVFKVFDLIFMFTQGGPGTQTESLSWYIYFLGMKSFQMSYAAAASYLVVIFLTVVVTLYAWRFLREERT